MFARESLSAAACFQNMLNNLMKSIISATGINVEWIPDIIHTLSISLWTVPSGDCLKLTSCALGWRNLPPKILDLVETDFSLALPPKRDGSWMPATEVVLRYNYFRGRRPAWWSNARVGDMRGRCNKTTTVVLHCIYNCSLTHVSNWMCSVQSLTLWVLGNEHRDKEFNTRR